MLKAQGGNYVFIKGQDALANEVNANANKLYSVLANLNVATLDTADTYRYYFKHHHLGRRLFFSMQNSTHIVYQSVKKSGKPVQDITFLDYGAGLGTLFMLAGMMGFKKVVYNDYFPEWHEPARSLCKSFGIHIDEFIAGDIEKVMQAAETNQTKYDIIASRNVIEHIYNLSHFYQCIQKHNRLAVVYSTTTANYHNPAMHWYHIYFHKKWEKKLYCPQREEEIKKLYPSVSPPQLKQMATLTRGKAQQDFVNAVAGFMNGNKIDRDPALRSNTCDCITGVWNEHLLTRKEYAGIIGNAGFKMEYSPGFWDTHYNSTLMNMVAACFNKIISLSGSRGVLLSPFVNVIAYN